MEKRVSLFCGETFSYDLSLQYMDSKNHNRKANIYRVFEENKKKDNILKGSF
jgi:hypothetical protein